MRISIVDDHKTDLEAHRSDCQDIQRKINADFLTEAFPLGEHETAHDAWEDYNIDFIEEAEREGTPIQNSTWMIDFLPCTGWDARNYNG